MAVPSAKRWYLTSGSKGPWENKKTLKIFPQNETGLNTDESMQNRAVPPAKRCYLTTGSWHWALGRQGGLKSPGSCSGCAGIPTFLSPFAPSQDTNKTQIEIQTQV